MALITVPLKSTNDDLSANEFNEIIQALTTHGLYDIKTGSIDVHRNSVFRGDVVIEGTLSIGGETVNLELGSLTDVLLLDEQALNEGQVLTFTGNHWTNRHIDGGDFGVEEPS